VVDTGWVRKLKPRESHLPLESTSIELRTHVRAVVGDSAYRWAVELGQGLALRALDRFDDLARTRQQAAMMLRASESVALILVESLHRRDLEALDRVEIEPLVRESVYRRVPLLELERIVREGHPWWSERMVYECAALVSVDEQLAEVNAATQLLFGLMNGILDRLRVLYASIDEELTRSPSATHREIVAEIIADPGGDHARAGHRLGYELDRRHHIGLIAWTDSDSESGAARGLTDIARSLLEQIGAQNTLVVPSGTAEVWAWGSRTSDFPGLRLAELQVPGVRAATGMPGFGSGGFASSHAEALIAQGVMGAASGLDTPVLAYRDVSLLRLLLKDPALADRFVREELGPLAGEGRQMQDLRTTLRCYLELRSPQAVAAKLFVSRSTVTYRLQQIEQLLRDPVVNRTAERLAALSIAVARPQASADGEAAPGVN
jgi:PucR C-terminal helix-turn-helix domain/GGDEF-like domain